MSYGKMVVLVGALAFASGCKAEQKQAACVEGASVACACPSGAKGAQVCNAQGTLGPCDCEPAAAATPVSAEAPAADPAAEQGQQDPATTDALRVSATSFGPFEADTVVEFSSLQALFPDHKVTKEVAADEGYEWTEFHVTATGSDAPALVVVPDEKSGKVASVQGMIPEVRHESGFGVGSSYEEVSAALGEMRCDGGIHEDVERVICRRRGDDDFRLQVTFEMGTDELAFKDDLKGAQRKMLEGKKVGRISWSPAKP